MIVQQLKTYILLLTTCMITSASIRALGKEKKVRQKDGTVTERDVYGNERYFISSHRCETFLANGTFANQTGEKLS